MVSAPQNPTRLLKMPPYLTTIEVEPVGRWFLSHWDRLNSGRGMSVGEESASESETEESEADVEFEDDIAYLRSLDPKETKEQDHYKVLGLGDLRHRCSDERIKKAYRFKVLRHHPDKREAAGEEVREGDDYFTCITRAFEILGVPSKRRAYDSVDPAFDDEVPEMGSKRAKGKDFYVTFGPAFERNARWSNRRPVPALGGDDAPRAEVDRFYKFWYAFDSWREFSYLDEEDKEKGSDRDERRWIEKNNRLQRAERKKEEMKRIRRLVDNSYNSDPRIARFLAADRQEKLDRKEAKREAVRLKREEEERVARAAEEEARLARERLEREEKARQEAAKKEKEAAKKAIKKERKTLRALCKEHDFYADPDDRVLHMAETDKLCELLDAVQLGELNAALQACPDAASGRRAFVEAFGRLNERMEDEKRRQLEEARKSSSGGGGASSGREWSTDELQLLIKAVNLFPAGTAQRWEVVAGFINQHAGARGEDERPVTRGAKETLAKAKEMQSGDFHLSALKEEANKKAFENLEKNQKKRDVKVDDAEASRRTESAAEVQGLNVAPWSAEEQKLLEQALKTYPASLGTERWDKISSCLPNRSKKDCMKRYKELAELIRAKKAAQAAAAATKR